MNCPTCDRALERATLLPPDGAGPDLRGFRCPLGHGVFLPSDLYFDWRDHQGEAGRAGGRIAAPDEVGDVKRAKLCPQDGRIMRRYRVSAAGGFWIDRCGVCGGAWFDGGEWEATAAAGLLDELPRVFSDAWQREAEEAEAAEARRERLSEAVGAEDLDRVDAFRAWAWSHPQRHLLLARLNERPTPDAPPDEPED
jgi:Zn-finger nucleic acid-binding protein